MIEMFKAYKDSMAKMNTGAGAATPRYTPIKETCVECGKEFTITTAEQQFASEGKGYVVPRRCPQCRAYRKSANKTIKCSVCGEEFDFKVGEQKFYKEHGLIDPKKCSTCRKIKVEEHK